MRHVYGDSTVDRSPGDNNLFGMLVIEPSEGNCTEAIVQDTPREDTRAFPTFWVIADFVINDLLVVIFSVADIILDLLVCRQFYITERYTFFYISVMIFFVAQLTYSFLFTAAWGRKLSPLRKTITFFLVLPFGQFVPFFTWVEAFRIKRLDDIIRYIGLQPTAIEDSTVDEVNSDGDGDMLWNYIQRKYQSHAGFLAESLAEAIPQCILQTIAVLTAQQASPVFIISIVISICVISSKGYLISYSIHRPTFCFNFICIIADCFNLFATCAWLFENGISSVTSGPLNRAWLVLFVLGCLFLVLGGLCLVVFSMLDDHLKIRHATVWGDVRIHGPVWYGVYVVRTVAWVLAIIPVCVVFLTSKLSLFPILLFRSLDPEHARHWSFYSSLYRFLSLRLADQRVQVANKFFLQCRRDLIYLRDALAKYNVVHDPSGRTRSAVERKPLEKREVIAWLKTVGKTRRALPFHAQRSAAVPFPTDDEAPPNLALLESLNSLEDAVAARTAVRYSVLANSLGLSKLQKELAQRSAIFLALFSDESSRRAQQLAGGGTEEPDGGVMGDTFMFYTGMVFMVVGLLSSVLWAPTFLACAVYGGLYPIVQLGVHLARGDALLLHGDSFVQHALTVVYIGLTVALVCLLPLVYRFQLFRTDVVDLRHFPAPFYDPCVVRELHRRFRNHVNKKMFERFLDMKFGEDIVRYIKGYVDGYDDIFA